MLGNLLAFNKFLEKYLCHESITNEFLNKPNLSKIFNF